MYVICAVILILLRAVLLVYVYSYTRLCSTVAACTWCKEVLCMIAVYSKCTIIINQYCLYLSLSLSLFLQFFCFKASLLRVLSFGKFSTNSFMSILITNIKSNSPILTMPFSFLDSLIKNQRKKVYFYNSK